MFSVYIYIFHTQGTAQKGLDLVDTLEVRHYLLPYLSMHSGRGLFSIIDAYNIATLPKDLPSMSCWSVCCFRQVLRSQQVRGR